LVVALFCLLLCMRVSLLSTERLSLSSDSVSNLLNIL